MKDRDLPLKLTGRLRFGRLAAVIAGLFLLWSGAAAAVETPTVAAQTNAGTHDADIAFLEEMGVFAGTYCEPGEFCPDQPAPRWAAAVWLVRVLEGMDPPSYGASSFVDVSASWWWSPHVERLVETGVLKGCQQTPEPLFCPHETLSRAQIATLLTRALDLPKAPPAGFIDTEGNYHQSAIDSLAGTGITRGCSAQPARYCPNQPVTRAQLASFLTRTILPTEHTAEEIAPEVVSVPGRSMVGDIPLTVYLCTDNPADYSRSDLVAELDRLSKDPNDVADFFYQQSSEQVNLQFMPGNIITADVHWDTATLDSLMGDHNPCLTSALQAETDLPIILLIDVPAKQIAGYAMVSGRYAVLSTLNHYRYDRGYYSAIMAHEIGHMWFGWGHPDQEIENHPGPCSLMWSQVCGNLDTVFIEAYQKRQAGWDFPQIPGPVTNLQVNQTTVSWELPQDEGGSPILGYKISYGSVAEKDIGNTLFFTISELTPGFYDITIIPYNSQGDGPPHTSQFYIADFSTLPSPNDLQVIGVGSTWFEIGWQAVAGAAYYEIGLYLGNTDNTSSLVSAEDWDSTAWYTVDAIPDSTYSFQTRGCNHSNECGDWSTLTVATLPKEPVALPAPPNLRVVSVGDTWFEVAWDSVPYALSYEIYYNHENGGGGAWFHAGSNETTIYTTTQLIPGETYKVTVNACLISPSNQYDPQSCGTQSTLTITTRN